MQPDSLIFLSVGITGCYRPSSRRPGFGNVGLFWGSLSRRGTGASAADPDALVLPAAPAPDPQHSCLLRGCRRRRKSWHGIVLPLRRQPASSPRFPPPLHRASPLTGLLPPPLLHLFSLFSPLTRTLPPAGAPSPTALHGKTQ